MKPQISRQILSLSLMSLLHFFFFFLMKAVKLLDSNWEKDHKFSAVAYCEET